MPPTTPQSAQALTIKPEGSSQSTGSAHAACPAAAPGTVTCFALINSAVKTLTSAVQPAFINGYHPVDVQTAYALAGAQKFSGTRTVAIVDAYDDPNAESDLAVYRLSFGLTPCTTKNGCFTKVQMSPIPAADEGWAAEESLDLDMVSATCNKCHIILVEASTSAWSDILAAVDKAAKLKPDAISNSYGASEFSAEATAAYNSHYNHPGIAVTASSGDSGPNLVEFPAASQYVTAVGGTSLAGPSASGSGEREYSETAWGGAGSGCSQYITAKPTWQEDTAADGKSKFGGYGTGCANRTVADVSAVADPNTGVAVYDTYGTDYTGWAVFGGTSVSSPIIASVYALAGNASSVNYGSYPYLHQKTATYYPCSSKYSAGGLFDVIDAGSTCASNGYLTQAVPGYDGPTGLGTPNGIKAF